MERNAEECEREVESRHRVEYTCKEPKWDYKAEEEGFIRKRKHHLRVGIAEIIGTAISVTLCVLQFSGVIDIGFLAIFFLGYALAFPKYTLFSIWDHLARAHNCAIYADECREQYERSLH